MLRPTTIVGVWLGLAVCASCTVKAVELSGTPGLLFRRNSVSGAVEVVARDGRGVELNALLH